LSEAIIQVGPKEERAGPVLASWAARRPRGRPVGPVVRAVRAVETRMAVGVPARFVAARLRAARLRVARLRDARLRVVVR
jgi:hypothetical protein